MGFSTTHRPPLSSISGRARRTSLSRSGTNSKTLSGLIVTSSAGDTIGIRLPGMDPSMKAVSCVGYGRQVVRREVTAPH